MNSMNLMYKKLGRIALGTAALLSIPMFGMLFGTEWNWGIADFLVAGVLLFGTGSAYELFAHKASKKYRGWIGVFLLALLLLVWAELAVGIF